VRYRGLLMRVLGATVAVIVLMAATQLLLLSFETDPLVSRGRIDDVVSWITGRPRTGVAMLSGIALLAVCLVAVLAFVRSFGTDRRVLTTRRRGGWTKLDRGTLEDAIERHVESIDRRNDVRVRVTQRGRVDLTITTPDISAVGPVQELRDAVDEVCVSRSLPCRSGRIVATVPRRVTSRRRIR